MHLTKDASKISPSYVSLQLLSKKKKKTISIKDHISKIDDLIDK